MEFGSVRFFKRLFLCLLALLILVPVTVCVVLGVQNHGYRVKLGLVEAPRAETGMRAAAADHEAPLSTPSAAPVPQEPTYQALYPDLYAAPANRGVIDEADTVYLTFEGGPSAETSRVLEILERYDVKATFFAVSGEDELSQARMAEIAEAGHTLGVHSYSSSYKGIYASVEAYLDDFYAMYQLIYTATGSYPQIFRFPGGSVNGYNSGIYQALIAEMTRRGFVYFDWNVATADAAVTNGSTLADQALAGRETLRRPVVLLSDGEGKTATAQALPAIIEGYQAAGFTFAALTPEVRQVALG